MLKICKKNEPGEWEDSYETIIGVYNDKSTAIRVADSEWEKSVNWKNNLPIPFETYRGAIENDKIPGFIEWEEGELDDHPFIDMDGYTKEDWIGTYNMINSIPFSDYHFSCVYEGKLFDDDSTYFSDWDNNEMKCVHDTLKKIELSGFR